MDGARSLTRICCYHKRWAEPEYLGILAASAMAGQ
jgi:hypothetical protein